MNALWRVIQKEFLQLRHDRRMIPVLFVAPALQLLALGYAANTDVTDIPVVLVDLDRGSASRALADRFTGSGSFTLAGSETSAGAIEPWLIDGRAQVALVIDAGYGEAIAAGRPAKVQVIADGTDSSSAVVGLGYASRIISEEAAARLRERRAAARPEGGVAIAGSGPQGALPARAGTVEAVPRVWYNPDLKSRWFYVPAVLAMTLMLLTMILPSMAVVREREIGTLEQILVTPLRPWQLIVGKLCPFAAIGLVNLLIVTALVVFLFGVPLRGSLASLVVLTAPFLLTTLGLGLMISTMVSNQQQAMLGSIFFAMVPMIYLSGLIFPIENMPVAIRPLTYAIPLRWYATVIRGVFLKGSGLAVLWPEMAVLTGFGVATLLLASLRFRKRLD